MDSTSTSPLHSSPLLENLPRVGFRRRRCNGGGCPTPSPARGGETQSPRRTSWIGGASSRGFSSCSLGKRAPRGSLRPVRVPPQSPHSSPDAAEHLTSSSEDGLPLELDARDPHASVLRDCSWEKGGEVRVWGRKSPVEARSPVQVVIHEREASRDVEPRRESPSSRASMIKPRATSKNLACGTARRCKGEMGGEWPKRESTKRTGECSQSELCGRGKAGVLTYHGATSARQDGTQVVEEKKNGPSRRCTFICSSTNTTIPESTGDVAATSSIQPK